jgi:DNA-binding protein H-NS
MMTVETMSLEELLQHLADLEQQRTIAFHELEQRKQQGKYDVAQQVRDLIIGQGYTLEEILPLVTAKRRRSYTRRQQVPAPEPTPQAPSTPQGVYFVDPDNPANIYVKGALPAWLKEKIIAQGLDPKSKEDRIRFKAEFLHRVGG